MARFLSPEWFGQLDPGGSDDVAPPDGSWVLEQIVTAAPDGEVRYQLVVTDGPPRLRVGGRTPPTVTFTSDYPTAAAIAQGELSTQAALLAGRVRVSGDLSGMAEALRHLSGFDLIPADLRVDTTY